MGLQLNEQGEWEHTEKSHTTQKRATNECYVTQIRAKKRPLALAVRLQQYQGLVWRGVYDGLKHILQSFSPSSAPRPEYQDLLCSPARVSWTHHPGSSPGTFPTFFHFVGRSERSVLQTVFGGCRSGRTVNDLIDGVD